LKNTNSGGKITIPSCHEQQEQAVPSQRNDLQQGREEKENWRTGKYQATLLATSAVEKHGKANKCKYGALTCVCVEIEQVDTSSTANRQTVADGGLKQDREREEEGTAATPMHSSHLNIKNDEYTTSTDISQHNTGKYRPRGTYKDVYGPEKHEIQGISIGQALICTEVRI
jgi:hypothetical protein